MNSAAWPAPSAAWRATSPTANTSCASSHQVLEQRVAERTSARQWLGANAVARQIAETRKTQQALRLANEQAQQANRAKSEFLSNMSHELRTPLHGVLGYAQILRRETDVGDPQRESLDAIERCGQHLLTLINEILDLTKIEAGEMQVEKQPTHLGQLIGDACTIVAQRATQADTATRDRRRHRGRSARTRSSCARCCSTWADDAVKFTSHGSVVLSVERTDDERLGFTVADSGVGIPEDKIEAVFDAFQQARQGQAVDGTGLGLAISQRLIRLLGGDTLRAESAPRRRQPLLVHDPVRGDPRRSASDRHNEAGAPLAHGAAVGRRRTTCRVLVIDDSQEGRRRRHDVVGMSTRGRGLANCGKAHRRLAEQAFDLVLLDVRLHDEPLPPVLSALRDAARDRRAEAGRRRADAFADGAAGVHAAGFDGFLAKPFSEAQVLDLIQSLADVHFVPARESVARIRVADRAGQYHCRTHPYRSGDGRRRQPVPARRRAAGARTRRPQTDVEDMAPMARMFDFDDNGGLSDRLRANA